MSLRCGSKSSRAALPNRTSDRTWCRTQRSRICSSFSSISGGSIRKDCTLRSAMRLIVGLGNPGAEYERTRHNIGWRVVEAFAKKFRIEVARHEKNALTGEG